MQKEKIGALQLFSLLFLCRMLTTVTFSPLLSDGNLNGDFFPNIIFAFIFIFLFCIPSILFYKKYPENNPAEIIKERSLFLGSVSTVFYISVFLYSACVSLSRFFVFLTSVIYPEKNLTLFLIIAVIISAYASYLGLEAVARGNVILLLITFIGVGTVLFAVSSKISIYNLEPLFYYPLAKSLESGLFAAGRTVEIIAFLFLTKRTSGKLKRGFIITLLFFVISLLVLFFYLNSVSGEFAETQLFPFCSLAVIARFPFFERLDAVVTAVWIFSILIKCSLFIFISSSLMNDGFKIGKRPSHFFCILIVSVLSFIFSLNLIIHKSVSSPYVFLIITLTGAILIPSVCLVLKKKEAV